MLIRSLLIVGASDGGGANPPTPPSPTLSVSFAPCIFPCDGGGTMSITWSVTNPVGGEYITVDWYSAGGFNGSDSGTEGPLTSSPSSWDADLCPGSTGGLTARLYSASNVLLDTVVKPSQTLPV